MDKMLGSGRQGKVYLTYEIINEESDHFSVENPLACKLIEREQLSANAQNQVANEIENLQFVRS
jgi:hypothetical protein